MIDINFEMRMGEFTGYVNKTLRNNALIKDWSFTVDEGYPYTMKVMINYVDDCHSIERYDLKNKGIDELMMEFNHYLARNLNKLRELKKKRFNSEWRNE